MTQVGVKALRDALSGYLHRVAAGERIVVTDRGRPVAVVAPVEEPAAARAAWDLVATGAAQWNGGKPHGAENPPRLPGGRAAAIVLQDRR
jgi:prevent-host-death family protein